MSSAAAADLAARLTALREDGTPVISGELALLIDARLLIEVGAAVGELDDQEFELLGAACELAGVSGGDPRPAIEEGIRTRSSTELLLLLRRFLSDEGDSDERRADLAALIGATSTKVIDSGSPPEGAVKNGPLGRFQMQSKTKTTKPKV